jgi:hypothetical protein
MSSNPEQLAEEKKFRSLRTFNIAMGFLHMVQGVLMLIIANESTLPLKTNFVSFNPDTLELTTVSETLINLRLGPFVAMFLFVSMIAHFAVSSPWAYDWYVRNLKKKINYARWFEYSISSSIMVVVIAMLCGIYDLSTIILLFSLNATMNLFGLMMELHNQTTQKTNWTAFILGCFAGLMVWVVLGVQFFGAVGLAGDFPPFVIFIFVSLAAFFNVFAINMLLQYRAKGRWKDYLFGERVYIILSLVAKSALAWQVFSGTLMGPVSGAA